MKKFIIFLHWLNRHCVLISACLVFMVSLSFTVHEAFEHSEVIKKIGLNNQGHNHTDIGYFLLVMYMMAASGFIMMVIIFGDLLTMSKMNRTLRDRLSAIESARDGIAILDSHGCYTYMNQAHAICYGYDSPRDLLGKNWRDLYDSSEVRTFEDRILPVLKQGEGWLGEARGRRRDARSFPQEVSLNLLENGGLICVVRDISEKQRNEDALRLVMLAIEAAQDGIAITDSDNRFLFMNESYLRIHGYDPAERDYFIGRDWREIYNEIGQAQINSIVLPTTILKGAWMGSMRVMRKDGSLFYGDASLTKLADGNILGVMRDVSQRVEAELEQARLKEKIFHTHKIESLLRISIASSVE